MTRKNISSLAIVVLIGLVLQIGFVALDCTHTPADTAVSFVRDYYNLSPDMNRWLCDASSGQCSRSVADDHIYEATADAAERGFDKGFAKYTLYHIETHTEYLDETTALVHLTAFRRIAINPLYAYVARLFSIGDTYEVDQNIVVKFEDEQWRVCRSSLSSLKTS